MTDTSLSTPRFNWWTVAFWAVQALLAFFYGYAGIMKLTQPLAVLAPNMTFVTQIPEWLTRFIGAAELAGAIGLILPAATRILPQLTTLAAVGLAAVQACAIVFHVAHGEFGILAFNTVLLLLALFVAWGRWKVAPIAAR
jgi:putative oxidoreductase